MKSHKHSLSIAVLLTINFLFIYKYVDRLSSYSLLFSIVLIALQLLVIKYYRKFNISKSISRYAPYLLSAGIVGFLMFTYFYIDIETINVDRHSVISSFIDTALRGEYPYLAESHRGNYPGPMPFYFLVALPFYLIGELAALSTIGYLMMIWVIKKELNGTDSLSILFILATSVFMYWEIATRSNIFTYSILVAVTLREYQNLHSSKNRSALIITGVLLGLLLSTRSVYIIPYIVFFLSTFIKKDMDFRKQVITVGIAVVAFLGSFVPLLILYGEQFFEMNPFVIQSSFLIPSYYILVFILISVAFSFLVRSGADKFFYSGISLFIAIAIYFVYHIAIYSFHEAYFGSVADISYFILCIPFLLTYLIQFYKKKPS